MGKIERSDMILTLAVMILAKTKKLSPTFLAGESSMLVPDNSQDSIFS